MSGGSHGGDSHGDHGGSGDWIQKAMLYVPIAFAVFVVLFGMGQGCSHHSEHPAPVPTTQQAQAPVPAATAPAPAQTGASVTLSATLGPPGAASGSSTAGGLQTLNDAGKTGLATLADDTKHIGRKLPDCPLLSHDAQGAECDVPVTCSGWVYQQPGSAPGEILFQPRIETGVYDKIRYLVRGSILEKKPTDTPPTDVDAIEWCPNRPIQMHYLLK